MTRFYGKKSWIGLAVVGLAALALWWQADALWAWHYVRRLAAADENQRAAWAQRVVTLDAIAMPRLLDHFSETDERRCRNVGYALSSLAQSWGIDDARGAKLLSEIGRRFTGFSTPGQIEALTAVAALLARKGAEAPLASAAAQEVGLLLAAAEKKNELRQPLLLVAAAFLERAPNGPWCDWCRDRALAGLSDPNPETRLAAVQVLLREPLRKDGAVLGHLVPSLKDTAPAVRKASLVALGPARDVLGDDELLPLLHDLDAEVRAMAEIVLRSRGLSDQHLHLARLISDRRPEARLQVLHFLEGDSDEDVEPGVWLHRLSQDSAPAVRAAAVRAASSQTRVDLRDRLRDMAIQDPSPTVRELAGHYFHRHQRQLQATPEDQ